MVWLTSSSRAIGSAVIDEAVLAARMPTLSLAIARLKVNYTNNVLGHGTS